MPSVEYHGVPYHVEGQGVIVIQEWWGLNDHIKNMTKRFAERLGALAISPDLYRGKCATVADEANHLMSHLDWPRAVEDIRRAAEYLRSKGCHKVGVVGFCMGGALTLASGVLASDALNAGVCFYGIPPASFADPKQLGIPMQFHFGDKDTAKGFSDKEAADSLRKTLEAAGKVIDFNQYPDGDHAFMNETAPAYPYNEKVAKIAMDKALAFFNKHLA